MKQLILLFFWLAISISLFAQDKATYGKNTHSHTGDEHGGEIHTDSDDKDDHDDHSEEEEHDEHGSKEIGAGKAIVAIANKGNKFKLSRESEEFLQIKTSGIKLVGIGKYQIPQKSIVIYQNSKGIYIKYEGWFEIKLVKILHTENDFSIVTVSGIDSNTMVASTGLGFLRAAHLEASGQGGKGHAH